MSLTIRKAKISDLLKTFEWANEKEVIKIIERVGKEQFIKKENLEKFTKEYFHKLDGKASERVGNQLLKIIQKKK